MGKLTTRLLCAFIITLGAALCTFAQSAADFSKGSITVSVKDASGASVPDAEVGVQGPQGTLKATTSGRGDYTFTSLTPGSYKLTVTKGGFSTAEVADIQVGATKTASVPVTLQAGQVTQTIEVQDTTSTIDTTSTTVQSNITASQYQSLPVTRNVTSLMYLAPGVADGGDTGTANPSISGASGLENQYIIDGINDTDPGYGGFGVYSEAYGSLGTGVNFDFVQEVQVKTGGFEAQYGQALGGIVNVVTKSGTNDLHGSIFGYSSPGWAEPRYNQVNDYPRTAEPQTETLTQPTWDFGFNVGGPLIKNKMFWYGAFDPSWVRADRRAPDGFGLDQYRYLSRTRRSLNWAGKLNYNLTDSQRLEATGFADPSHSPATIQGSLLRDNLDASSILDYGTRNWAVKYSGTFGPATIVSASFAWNHTEFTESPETNNFELRNYGAPTASSLYTLQGGLGYLSNSIGNNKQYNAMVSRIVNVLGSHTIDLGYSYNQVNYDAVHIYTGPDYPLPAADGIDPADVGKLVHGGYFYQFVNTNPDVALPALCANAGLSTCFRISRGNFSNPNVGTNTDYNDAFLEDAWQMNRFVTIKAGVRWEQQHIFGNLNNYTFAANWAPRMGFIVDPTGHGKTKLFGNWGRFFEKIPQDLAVRALSQESGYAGTNSYLAALPTSAGAIPIPGAVFAGTGTSPTIIYGGTKAAYQEEVAAGFEQDFSHGIVVRGSFTHRSLMRGMEDTSGITVEQYNAGSPLQYVIQNPSVHSDTFHNAVLCADPDACADTGGYTADSGSLGPDGLVDGFPDMRRVYNAFEISAEKRFSSRWSLIANYRLAKLFGNYEGSFRNDNGQSDPNITSLFDFVNSPAIADQFRVGVLPTDRRHIVNAYASYRASKNLTLGIGYTTQSGTPISEFDAHPAYQDEGEIPVGGRGAFGRTPWQGYVDTRAAYSWPITERVRAQFAADMFNIGNRQTEATIDQNHELSPGDLNPDFLKPLTYHRPFHAQFSFRLEF
jgi:outer membrane receptor for ferrienterochelin and colicin